MPSTITRFSACAAILVAAFTFSTTATSHSTIGSDEGGNLTTLVERSNLVFIGRVARVDYRTAQMKEGAVLPFAFVTYRMSRRCCAVARRARALRCVLSAEATDAGDSWK